MTLPSHLIGDAIRETCDGKNAKADAASGAAITAGGLAISAVVLGAPVTIPLLIFGGLFGGAWGFAAGQNKKEGR